MPAQRQAYLSALVGVSASVNRSASFIFPRTGDGAGLQISNCPTTKRSYGWQTTVTYEGNRANSTGEQFQADPPPAAAVQTAANDRTGGAA
jgi:hypothetical protein